MDKPVVPAAILLTHVCALWRRTALSSPELWNNISLSMTNCDCSILPCALELLSRARDLPMNLQLTFAFHRRSAGDCDFDFGDAVYQLTSNRSIRKLGLTMFPFGLTVISQSDIFTTGTFDHIRDLDLSLHGALLPVLSQTGFPHLEAFSYSPTADPWGNIYLPSVPWSQLRRLNLSPYYEQDVPTTLGLLSQCTLIEECKLLVIASGSTMDCKVTLRNLRDLEFGFIHVLEEDFDILDGFFGHLSFPNLKSLAVFKEEARNSEDELPLASSRVMSPLARNLKLMAPQLQDLRFSALIDVDECEVRTLWEHMPSVYISLYDYCEYY